MAVRPIDADEFEQELLCDMALHGEQLSGDAAYNRALVILTQMPTLTPQNEPLTIEQLREMDGEPVYAPETNCWVLITKNQFVPLFTWPDGEQCSAHDWYEQVGPVYRRPPERQEDT